MVAQDAGVSRRDAVVDLGAVHAKGSRPQGLTAIGEPCALTHTPRRNATACRIRIKPRPGRVLGDCETEFRVLL